MRRACSLTQFQKDFPDEPSCAAYLGARRSALAGRVCLSGLWGKRLGMLRGRAHTFECLACGRQTSITLSTALHRSKCPLQMWFWAEHLATTHSNGMTA